MDSYLVIALLGQMLGGVVAAVGVIIGLRLALPSLARALVREVDAHRHLLAQLSRDRPVVTVHPHDEAQ